MTPSPFASSILSDFFRGNLYVLSNILAGLRAISNLPALPEHHGEGHALHDDDEADDHRELRQEQDGVSGGETRQQQAGQYLGGPY